MIRTFGFLVVAGFLAGLVSAGQAAPAGSQTKQYYDPVGRVWFTVGPSARHGGKSLIEREIVDYAGPHGKNTIIVNTPERRLYYVLGDGKALKYGVGVGREGFQWAGTHRITRKAEWPGWTPPAAMRARQPGLPAYMEGGPRNPLGARALYIGSTLYRIHGSNEPASIGHAVSSGCIRMVNDDVIDLYERVDVGTKVVVIQ